LLSQSQAAEQQRTNSNCGSFHISGSLIGEFRTAAQ
jgi:hypothetical protein